MKSTNEAPLARSLAPGFRFHPTDEELVTYYLRRKVCGNSFRFQPISEIDVYKSEPWELFEFSSMGTNDQEWYFFSPLDRKHGNGSRLNRATRQGYWKATGNDRPVHHQNRVIGMKKILVFYIGRSPNGKRTDWVMHEYRLVDECLERTGVSKDAFVLCRIFHKSGLGTPHCNRYAPFIEEEWDDDNYDLLISGGEADEGEMFTNDEMQVGGKNFEKEMNLVTKVPILCMKPMKSHNFAIIHKHDRSEEKLKLSLYEHKKSKPDDPSCSRDVSHTTMKCFSSKFVELPLLEPFEPTECPTNNSPTFDSSNLEKYVPPGYLDFISKLETAILSVSVERDTLKLEVMRALAQINDLESKVALMSNENVDLKRIVCPRWVEYA